VAIFTGVQMKRIAIYVDLSNLYYCLKQKYGKKLDYTKLYKFVSEFGSIVIARAYGAHKGRQVHNFLHALQKIGFTPIYKSAKTIRNGADLVIKANCDLEIAIDAIERLEEYDTLFLCTADGDFLPLVKYLNDQGKKVIVVASTVSHELKDCVLEFFEIPASFMEER
jgi:uncharacterized protein (TIGR00288 family)